MICSLCAPLRRALTGGAGQERTTGEIVNLMSTDAERMFQATAAPRRRRPGPTRRFRFRFGP